MGRYLLGTYCTISLFDDELPDSLVDDSFGIIEDIENRMSINIANSEISEINNNSGIRPVTVSDDIIQLIQESIHYSELSDGKFDISIGPLVKLWNIGNADARVPNEEQIGNILNLVNFRNIEIDNTENTVYLRNYGMMLDLGGIAKGYAADRVRDFLLENSVRNAIINMGGNVLVIGGHPDKRPWRIGVQDPFNPGGNIVGVIDAVDETVVTSGVYERYFIENGIRYHHILNTETGYPVDNGLVSVTVITDSSTKADALSTTIFVLGLMDGMKIVETLDNVEAIFINDVKEIYLSKGIRSRFSLTDNSFRITD